MAICLGAELEAIELSALQQMELDCVYQLASGTQEEQLQSLAKLAQLPICDATQATVASCLQDAALAVRLACDHWNIHASWLSTREQAARHVAVTVTNSWMDVPVYGDVIPETVLTCTYA